MRLQQQIILFDDFATDEIRQAAVGKRNMRPSLKDDDVTAFAEPSGARGGTCPAGDASNDDQRFGVHRAE
jgi:hypothetical protein